MWWWQLKHDSFAMAQLEWIDQEKITRVKLAVTLCAFLIDWVKRSANWLYFCTIIVRLKSTSQILRYVIPYKAELWSAQFSVQNGLSTNNGAPCILYRTSHNYWWPYSNISQIKSFLMCDVYRAAYLSFSIYLSVWVLTIKIHNLIPKQGIFIKFSTLVYLTIFRV